MTEPRFKSVLVIGASENPERTSHMAVLQLQALGYQTKAVGLKKGMIGVVQMDTLVKFDQYHTITLYVNPTHQDKYLRMIAEILKPKRVIFNPGTENPHAYSILTDKGIEVLEACTLVMLRTGQF